MWGIMRTLEQLVRACGLLILWLDYDPHGENIGLKLWMCALKLIKD